MSSEAKTGLKLLSKLTSIFELRRCGSGAHEKSWIVSGVYGEKSAKAAIVPFPHAGVGRIIVPEGMVMVPEHDHVARVWDGRPRDKVIEALEIIPDEVQHTIDPSAYPVKRKGLGAPAKPLEGQLGATEASKGDEWNVAGALVRNALSLGHLWHRHAIKQIRLLQSDLTGQRQMIDRYRHGLLGVPVPLIVLRPRLTRRRRPRRAELARVTDCSPGSVKCELLPCLTRFLGSRSRLARRRGGCLWFLCYSGRSAMRLGGSIDATAPRC
mmetsp:Transcript_56133/g.121469  ORF Transcript_56133/g.121469 Transcript_56133/m.121469 type:complete len:268 (-) Transcript_56133:484-1287(-)